MTRNSNSGDPRPQISWNNINNTAGPSTGGLMVRDIRNPSYEFVYKVLEEIDISDDEWKSTGVTKEEFIRQPNNFKRLGDKDKEAIKRFEAAGKVDEIMTRHLTNAAGMEKVINVLADFADTMVAEHNKEYSLDQTRDYLKQRRAAGK